MKPTVSLTMTSLPCLVRQRDVEWQNRAHFCGVAAQAMRRILVDHARTHRAGKRGGAPARVTLDDALAAIEARDVSVIALDRALERLAALDPRLSRVVELRYFGGLTKKEAAEALGVSTATVDRETATATAWLRRELKSENQDDA